MFGVQTGKEPMGITCEEVWREISNYIDNELNPIRRAVLTQHFAECQRCTAALERTRNVIRLYRDERIFVRPEGFHDRLQETPNKLLDQAPDQSVRPSRRAILA
jgi:anti-sigma factor RsiW